MDVGIFSNCFLPSPCGEMNEWVNELDRLNRIESNRSLGLRLGGCFGNMYSNFHVRTQRARYYAKWTIHEKIGMDPKQRTDWFHPSGLSDTLPSSPSNTLASRIPPTTPLSYSFIHSFIHLFTQPHQSFRSIPSRSPTPSDSPSAVSPCPRNISARVHSSQFISAHRDPSNFGRAMCSPIMALRSGSVLTAGFISFSHSLVDFARGWFFRSSSRRRLLLSLPSFRSSSSLVRVSACFACALGELSGGVLGGEEWLDESGVDPWLQVCREDVPVEVCSLDPVIVCSCNVSNGRPDPLARLCRVAEGYFGYSVPRPGPSLTSTLPLGKCTPWIMPMDWYPAIFAVKESPLATGAVTSSSLTGFPRAGAAGADGTDLTVVASVAGGDWTRSRNWRQTSSGLSFVFCSCSSDGPASTDKIAWLLRLCSSARDRAWSRNWRRISSPLSFCFGSCSLDGSASTDDMAWPGLQWSSDRIRAWSWNWWQSSASVNFWFCSSCLDEPSPAEGMRLLGMQHPSSSKGVSSDCWRACCAPTALVTILVLANGWLLAGTIALKSSTNWILILSSSLARSSASLALIACCRSSSIFSQARWGLRLSAFLFFLSHWISISSWSNFFILSLVSASNIFPPRSW